MRVLYLTNIEVPYRIRFFNELSKYCDLTVLYERKKSNNRDDRWTKSENKLYKVEYLEGLHIKNENSFSIKIFKYFFDKFDRIIVGCYNSPVQQLFIFLLKITKRKYILNLDGEIFLPTIVSIKSILKRFFIKGAYKYLIAGEKSAHSLRQIVNNTTIIPYYFSSLTNEEIELNSSCINPKIRNNEVLVVGQYFDYKGMDIMVEVARQTPDIMYKFIGMGVRTDFFIQNENLDELKNVQVISFLSKLELVELYKCSKMLVLPSRQECWGLVINEAASFGLPIASTYGSGAAVEFLDGKYSKYLAVPNSVDSLKQVVLRLYNDDVIDYSVYLINKSKNYSIEHSVKQHYKALEIDEI